MTEPTRPADLTYVERFLSDWRPLSPNRIASFIQSVPHAGDDLLIAIITADGREHFGHKLCPPLERYVDLFPQLFENEQPLRTIVDSWLPSDVASRHKHLADLRRGAPEVMERYQADRQLDQSRDSQDDRDDDVLTLEAVKSMRQLADFKLLRGVGKGAFGHVYLAKDETLDRCVALKVSRQGEAEGRILAKLNHPNIVRVYRQQTFRGLHLLAMQFVVGHTLRNLMDANFPGDRHQWRARDILQWSQNIKTPDGVHESDTAKLTIDPDWNHTTLCVHLISTIASALHHAHQRGVLHQDIKPANILLDRQCNALLTDFNVASVGKVPSDTVAGTLSYMSPENLQLILGVGSGETLADIRSDIYSLGTVLYELISGTKCSAVDTGGDQQKLTAQLLAQRLRKAPASLSDLPGGSHGLVAIINQALQPLPSDRYQTAAEFASDLRAWKDGTPIEYARVTHFGEKLVRQIRFHRKQAVLASIGLLAVLLGTGMKISHERSKLNQTVSLVSQAKEELDAGNGAGAAERIGAAKSRMTSVSLLRWIEPPRCISVEMELNQIASRISQFELQRFVSQFGEHKLLSLQPDVAASGTDLIDNTLMSYGVLQRDDWQSRSPYADLTESQKTSVSENITELLIVSLMQSRQAKRGTDQEYQLALSRLPKEHQDLPIVDALRSGTDTQYQPGPIDEVSDSFAAYLNGVLLALRGDDAAAHAWLDHSIRRRRAGQQPRFWAYYWNGVICQRLEDETAATVNYGICIGLRPDFTWPVFNMGLLCAQTGKRQLAQEYFEQSIELNEQFVASYVALGALFYRQEKFDQCHAIYQLAIKRGLDSADLQVGLAMLALRKQDNTLAAHHLKSALAIDPNNARALQLQNQISRSE